MEQKDVVEASRLKDEIETTMEEIRESKLYTKLSNYLKNDPEIRSNVSRMLGTHEHIQMVIYGVGSIEISYTSQYQLALALLLMKDSCFPIGEIEVFDPAMSSADIKACSDLGCRVLLINEQCRRTVEKPTLFYIPGLLTHLVGNLIKVNFHPCRLNQMILLQYDQMKSPGETTGKSVTLKDERMMYDSIITKYCSKTVCLREFSNATSCLWELMFSFFDLDPSLDMKAFIPRVSMKDLLYHDYIYDMWDSEHFLYDRVAYRRTWNARYILEPFSDEKLLTLHSSDDDCYDDIDRSKYWSLLFDNERLPARYRCTWHQPHRGWIKLNYSGRSHGKEGPAGYGGTFHDEHREVLLSYAGPLENADFIMASLEGLRQGLRCLTKLPHIPKLIIEGDALSITRWMNEAFPPPERVAEGFEEIYRLIKPVECVVVHVDNEANQMAIGLANKGAKLERLCIWQQQDDPGAVTQELPGQN